MKLIMTAVILVLTLPFTVSDAIAGERETFTKEWVRHFKAPRQSTLFLYRGGEQLWFSVAETRRDPIFAAILKAAEQE